MAKSNPTKGTSAKIRFVMLEADISDGDLTQITQAIQNAFRPNAVVQHRSAATPAIASASLEIDAQDEVALDHGLPEDFDGREHNHVVSSRASKPRKPPALNVLDLDLKTDRSWEDFAKEHDPQSDVDKFLTVAVWFKEHRATDAITADHVYTCFRAIGWSTSIPDFGKPLRNLKQHKFMGSGPNRGEFVINHLGIDKVLKLKVK